MDKKRVNIWGVDWVIECLNFEKHIKRLIFIRKKLEKEGYQESTIKERLFLMCKHWVDIDKIKGGGNG